MNHNSKENHRVHFFQPRALPPDEPYFEGLSEEDDLARRGYSRDHRSDCKQIMLALIVTREGVPLAHLTLAGNTQDVETVKTIVEMVETRFGRSQRIWVMDRGMISKETLKLLNQAGRRYLLATRRDESRCRLNVRLS